MVENAATRPESCCAPFFYRSPAFCIFWRVTPLPQVLSYLCMPVITTSRNNWRAMTNLSWMRASWTLWQLSSNNAGWEWAPKLDCAKIFTAWRLCWTPMYVPLSRLHWVTKS
eukprot:4297794-Pyramimonas_sp.AAC.2